MFTLPYERRAPNQRREDGDRRMKYSAEIVKEISGYIEDGYNQLDSALKAGISEPSFYRWLEEKQEFQESVKKAHAVYKSKYVGIIQKAADNSWQAAAWLMERRYKQEFSLRREVTGKDGAPAITGIKVEVLGSKSKLDTKTDQEKPT